MPISEIPAQSAYMIVIYDGRCGLCHRSVRYILNHDHHDRFRFAANTSGAGRSVLARAGMSIDPPPESIVVVENGSIFTESDAVLAIAQKLGGIHRALVIGRVIPKCVRNWLYKRIARNRYRIFGQYEACQLPSQGELAKFLDHENLI